MFDDLAQPKKINPKYLKALAELKNQEFVIKLNGTQMSTVLVMYFTGLATSLDDPKAAVIAQLILQAIPLDYMPTDEFTADYTVMDKTIRAVTMALMEQYKNLIAAAAV